MLKKSKDGQYVISSHKEADEALEQAEELSLQLVEVTKRAEEEYGLTSLQTEATELVKAVHAFMISKNVDEIERSDYRLKVVRRFKRQWNADKLKGMVTKGVWLKITDQTPNSDKIDDLVRQNKLKLEEIEAAFEEKPERPHVRRYEISNGDEEATRVAEVLGS